MDGLTFAQARTMRRIRIMQRILVTGGAGFLGSHLCDRLVREGHEVVCVDDFMTGRRENVAHLADSGRFALIHHDVCQPLPGDAVACVDAIYHLACPASPVHYQRDPIHTIVTAVQGTRNVLEVARHAGARVLIASTSEVYGDPQEHPQKESYWGHVNPIGERACYDEGKRCAEALAVAYAQEHGVQVRIARIFNTYGPRMHEHDGRVVSSFVSQALRGQPLTIYGTGQQTRSFCYVSDLIDALTRLMAYSRDPGPVNLGNPEELTIRELAALVLELTESPSLMESRPLPEDDPARRRPDITKARELLDWSPQVPLRSGVRATIEYFKTTQQSTPLPPERVYSRAGAQ
jgi:UDP-glucuronate decarboxylase